MLSKEDSRRLAQLERQLRRDDPEFCERMAASGRPHLRRGVSVSLVLVAVAAWVSALILAVAGWWVAAAFAGVCATVIVVALAVRNRAPRSRPSDPGPLPPAW